MDMERNRGNFQSRFGFILACVGSAVGMGNIWLFPYRVGQFGGAAFLIAYFIFVALIGYTGVIGEMAFGRAMGTGPLGAFNKALKRRGKDYGSLIGLIPVIGSLGIAIGYSVVVGWILRFTIGSLTGSLINSLDSGEYFGMIAGRFGSIGWHVLALSITLLIMVLGVSDGIERINKFMMPAFFGMFLILAIRVFFLPESQLGYNYLFKIEWKVLANPQTWVFALGQAFFSLSLAGSGTLVYGSYLKKDEDIVYSAAVVSIFDTIAAILAALVIIPSVFAFNMDPATGPPLMFITMPEIFKQIPLGRLFSSIFFIGVLFAGITSLINLFEVSVESIQERLGYSRFKSVLIIAIVGITVGIFIEDGNILDIWMDVVSIYIIPLGALLAGIMFYWVCGFDFVKDSIEMGREGELGPWFEPISKYLFVGLTIIVYIMGILYGGIG